MVDFVDFCPSLRVLEKEGGGGGVLFAGECDGELTGFVEDESTMHIHKRLTESLIVRNMRKNATLKGAVVVVVKFENLLLSLGIQSLHCLFTLHFKTQSREGCLSMCCTRTPQQRRPSCIPYEEMGSWKDLRRSVSTPPSWPVLISTTPSIELSV
jgi:hypothetical protein